jgi:uncharacterized glyoxalase superfamily protein PhnB
MPKIAENNNHVMPFMLVENATAYLPFLTDLFGAELLLKIDSDDGLVRHAQMRIGDSTLMIANATKGFGPNQSMLYIYVDDTDATYAKALSLGATSIMAPYDEEYGARSAGLLDPYGNTWWLATLK